MNRNPRIITRITPLVNQMKLLRRKILLSDINNVLIHKINYQLISDNYMKSELNGRLKYRKITDNLP